MTEEEKTTEESSEKSSDSLTITLKKDQMWKYSTFVLGAILIIGAFVFFVGGDDNNAPTGLAVDAPSVPTQPSAVQASEDDDAVLGDPNAPVTIIEFSDYQCPFCQRHYLQTHPQLIENYVDTGKVKIVFRDFPLTSIHPQAQKAAEAAECVGDQGGDEAYYEMHDLLFENQNNLGQDNLIALADSLGYDIADCLESGEFASEVTKDTNDAQAAGGRGTPYFVINGKPLSGAQPYSAFQQAIEAEL